MLARNRFRVRASPLTGGGTRAVPEVEGLGAFHGQQRHASNEVGHQIISELTGLCTSSSCSSTSCSSGSGGGGSHGTWPGLTCHVEGNQQGQVGQDTTDMTAIYFMLWSASGQTTATATRPENPPKTHSPAKRNPPEALQSVRLLVNRTSIRGLGSRPQKDFL